MILAANITNVYYIRVMKILVVTDVQRDFFDPHGSLYVKGGEALPSRIVEIAGNYDGIIFTLDWHPGDHCSFKEQGGPWPPHCVAFTQGAGLADEFAPLLADGALIHFKGEDAGREQYAAFENLEDDDPIRTVLAMADQIDVCGIAGDYCVKETVASILRHADASKVAIVEDCTVSIDNGDTLKAFIKENNVRTK